MNKIYLMHKQEASYPDRKTLFHPSKNYPEYPFLDEDTTSENNDIYEMIRRTFNEMGYDKENYGTPEWNPLSVVIAKGDTVVIKPNWVMHYNKNKEYRNNFDCLVTHPSVVRCVIDYTIKALGATGRIIVGDAPMQGCDLDSLLEKTGYLELFRFYEKKNIHVEKIDFRKYAVTTKKGIISRPININNDETGVEIDLGKNSLHFEAEGKSIYKVSDYLASEVAKYHNSEKHIYKIHEKVLLADVIINIPKPKTHRLAGFTGGMKNLVGVTFDKVTLPHRKQGANENSCGDSYQKKSFFKEKMESIEEKKLLYSNKNEQSKAIWSNYLLKMCYLIGRITTRDPYRIGSWYGNDTIWRTVIDLNQIIKYADKTGLMTNKVQRKVLTIGDMIICGEGEGPVSPSPKKLGMILVSKNIEEFDLVLCKLMGFDQEKIKLTQFLLKSCGEEIYLKSNDRKYDRLLSNIDINSEQFFKSVRTWENNKN